MKAQVAVLLAHHQIELDEEDGFPLVFTLRSISNEEPEPISWMLELEGYNGMNKKSAKFVTTIPNNTRDTAYENVLIAAVTSTLPELRSLLVELEKGHK